MFSSFASIQQVSKSNKQFWRKFWITIELDVIGYFRLHTYAHKQKATNCMHAVYKQVILTNAFILRTNCTHTSHQPTTATQWWHKRANCMYVIWQKSKARDMLPYVSKLHTCKLSAKQPFTLLLLNYMYAQCVQGCAILLRLF